MPRRANPRAVVYPKDSLYGNPGTSFNGSGKILIQGLAVSTGILSLE